MMEENKQNSCALLIIDVQRGLFNKKIPIYKADSLLGNINLLVSKAHLKQIPVIYIQHSNDSILVYGSEDWQLHESIQPSKEDELVHKKHGNAFEETNLQEILQSKAVNCLIITGLVTHGCVKATSFGALKLGYKTILVEDAHSNYSKDASDLINKWNDQLKKSGALVMETLEIKF